MANLSWEEELKHVQDQYQKGLLSDQQYATRLQEITGMDFNDDLNPPQNSQCSVDYDFLSETDGMDLSKSIAISATNNNSPSAVLIEEGIVHLKYLLSQDEQILLYKGILESAYTHTPTRARNPKSVFTKTIAFNCRDDREYSQVPQSFKDFSLRSTKLAHATSSVIPPAYKPDYITSFIYPVKDGRLTGHCDKVLGWVVLFSLGCTARFWIQTPAMKRRTYIEFQSGDVLVFNGGTEFDIQHGIDDIVPNSSPTFLPELAESRVSLQLRQTERNDNVRWNHNKKHNNKGQY